MHNVDDTAAAPQASCSSDPPFDANSLKGIHMAHDTLISAEAAILEEVSRDTVENGSASAAHVIKAASTRQPAAAVRQAYWQLISETKLVRSTDGRLTLG